MRAVNVKLILSVFSVSAAENLLRLRNIFFLRHAIGAKNYLRYFAIILPRDGLTSSPYKELTGTSELCKLEYLFVRPLCAGTVLLCCWCVCYACYVSV